MDENMNEYPWHYLMRISPFIKKDEIEEVVRLNQWDLMFIFKDGRKIVYDTFTNYHRYVFYDDIKELSKEQEKIEFARKLRSIMQRKWITQDQLAERLGTSQTMISHYMTGRCIPTATTLRDIAKILNCSMDEFFYDDFKNIKED